MTHARFVMITYLLTLVFVVVPFSGSVAKMPTSSRAQKAISEVLPILKQALAKMQLEYGERIYIRIFKQEQELELWVRNRDSFSLFKRYHVCTYGYGGLGPKLREGDGKAPEGFYFVGPNAMNPSSRFHLSFNLGYPNQYDRQHKRTGSALMVHGDCVSIGCYAITDDSIEEIYAMADAALRGGQKYFRVHIFPFRMTEQNMRQRRESEWFPFWLNLKQGYDLFQQSGNRPPNVEVRNSRYVFEAAG